MTGLELNFIATLALYGSLLCTTESAATTGTCSTEGMRRAAVSETLAHLGCDDFNCGISDN